MTTDPTTNSDAPTTPLEKNLNPEFLPVPVDIDPADIPDPEDPVASRSYLEIRPSEARLSPHDVLRAMDLLYSLLESSTRWGFRHALTRSVQFPLVEWLLVSNGRADASVRYLVGTTHEDLLSEVEGVLRTCFPRTYEIREVQYHPRFVEDCLPFAPPDTTKNINPSVDPERLVSPYVAGVQYEGAPTLRYDWQTPLKTIYDSPASASRSGSRFGLSKADRKHEEHDSRRVPLAALLEAMGDAELPVIYQVLCQYRGDAHTSGEVYRRELQKGTVTLGEKFWGEVSPKAIERDALPPAHYRGRYDAIEDRNLRQTFTVSARAVAVTRHTPARANRVANRLTSVLGHLSGRTHKIRGRLCTDAESREGTTLYEQLCARKIPTPTYETRWNALTRNGSRSAGMIVTPSELAGFCLLDGGGITPSGQRALATRTTERTGLQLPPPTQLLRYQSPGQALVMPLTQDRKPTGNPLVLPPTAQCRHILVSGGTGSGKSVLSEIAALTNVVATAGPELLFFHKAGTASEFLQAYYGTFGNLDNVLYFDLTEWVPATPFFDITPLLEAGLPREEARSRKAGHYEEILKALLGSERYLRATESPRLIRNTVRAFFDPIHGSTSFSHADLYQSLDRMQSREEIPAVSDDALETYFEGLLERDRDVFGKVAGGAMSRVESIATDGRLAPLFDHVQEQDAKTNTHADDQEQTEDEAQKDETETPCFDFTEVINEDRVVVFDFGGMDTRAKDSLTLTMLSELWTALKARAEKPEESPPQVNCYFDEAGEVAETELMDTLLSQGRSFGLSILLGVQFPSQLDSPDPESNTYEEALNEIATVVTGNVSLATDLAEALATPEMPPRALKRRLASMPSGEWLVRPASGFGDPTVRPFLGQSLPAPPGHPASETPLEGTDKTLFEAALLRASLETERTAGLTLFEPTRADRTDVSGTVSADTDDDIAGTATASGTAGDPEADSGVDVSRTDSLLPYTQRLPDCLSYDEQRHAVTCQTCQTQYDPGIEGLLDAIECCHSLTDVDRDDIPVTTTNLKRTPDEIAASEWSPKALLFLQVVHNAQQRQYHPMEYDLTRDTMVRLREYVGIDPRHVTDLLDADLLRRDCTHPHLLYSLSPEGRNLIGEHNREGIDHGDGQGDLGESSQHVMMVQFGEALAETFVEDPDSPVVRVRPYHELEDGHRLDVACFDEHDEIVVTIEAERVNHDVGRAAPEDFDKMAGCDPEEAIWIVAGQTDAGKITSALHEPVEGDPRIPQAYSSNTSTLHYGIDESGMTEVLTIGQVQTRLAKTDSE